MPVARREKSPGDRFNAHSLFCIGEAASDPFRLKSIKTRMIEVDFDAIKPMAFCGRTGLIQGGGPAPKCFEKQQP